MSYSVILLKKAEEFLNVLEPKLAAKAFREIGLLKEIGPMLTFPHTRKIEGTQKLYELRVKQGTNICRLFYFTKDKKIFIVTSGYIKKTNKTDKDEIKRAVRLMNEYLGGE